MSFAPKLELPFAKGVASQAYKRAEQSVLLAQKQGCSHCIIDLSLSSDRVEAWSTGRRAGVTSSLKAAGLHAILHGDFRAPLSFESSVVGAAVLDHFSAEIDLAAYLDAPLVLHGGVIVEPRPTRLSRSHALDRVVDLVAEVAAIAELCGVTLWLENLSYYPGYRPFSYAFAEAEEIGRALEEVPYLKFVLDVGHANVNQDSAILLFQRFHRSVAGISFSDNDGRTDGHLPLGSGSVPLSEIIAAVRQLGWRGIVSLETRGSRPSDGIDYLNHLWRSLSTE